MKWLLVVAILAFVAFSGCVQQSPEERAIALADNTPEIKLISKIVNGLGDMENCTVDKFYAGFERLTEMEGLPFPMIGEEERSEVEAMIEVSAGWSAKCKPRLSKSAEKEPEGTYLVSYGLMTSADAECKIGSAGEGKVRVDLAGGTTTVLDMSDAERESMQSFDEMLDVLGDCRGVIFFLGAMADVADSLS